MNPLKLKLKGFRGIRDGLGRSEFTLDVEALAPDERLVALNGPNGKGKTTVLDNLQPYPILPSRSSSYSLGAFSMYDHIVGSEATKDLWWSLKDRRFHTVNVWRISGKRKSAEAYLFEERDGVETPVVAPDGTISDGKVETYMRVLEQILVPTNVYFAAFFSAQERRKLSDYKEGEIKTLLAEMLALGELQDIGAKAAKVVSGIASAIAVLRASISSQPGVDAQQAQAAKSVAEVRLMTAQQQLTAAESAVTSAQAALVTEEAAFGKQEGAAAARAGILREIGQLDTSLKEQEEASTKKLGEVAATRKGRDTELAKVITDRERDTAQRTKEIQDLQVLIAQRDAILAAPEKVVQLTVEVESSEKQLATARERLAEHARLTGESKTQEVKVVTFRNQYKDAQTALTNLKNRAALAAEVPCKGTELQPQCKLLRDALEALKSVPDGEKKLQALLDSGTEAKTALDALTAKIAAIPASPLAEMERALAALRISREQTQLLAAKAPLLQQAETIIASANESITQNATAIAEAKRGMVDAAKAEQDAKEAEVQRMDGVRKEAATRTTLLQAELAKHPEPDRKRVDAARATVAEAGVKQRAATQELTSGQAAMQQALGMVKAAETRATLLKAQTERLDVLLTHHARWQLMAKCFGRDGLISMLIDEAGPTLAEKTNEILLDCYGPRFSVSVKTQDTLANGTLSETFDIVVYDAESTETKSLRNMSGGERVWINDALSKAIALHVAQSHDVQFEALFGDEADGALDPMRKEMFLAMTRKVLDMGDYKRTFIITHTPELLSKVDKVIEIA